MANKMFQLETELQNIPEAAPKASRSFSASEKLARYGLTGFSVDSGRLPAQLRKLRPDEIAWTSSRLRGRA
jgi:hypothetical protein